MQTDKICALIIIGLGLIYCLLAYFIPAGLDTETLGPRFYPLIIGFAFSISGILLFFQNRQYKIYWPPLATWYTLLKLLAGILIYAYFITKLGFLISTSLLVMFLAKLFLATNKKAIITGIAISIALYVIFDFLLDLPLPWGDWIALLIEEI